MRASSARGIDPPLSTLADQVGHGTFAVMPLFQLIERHVLAAERLHRDDTTIRILAKSKCTTGRIWTYVRDDRPYGGPAPPAAVYYASSDRRGEHPQKHLATFTGILQADCYNGFEPLFDPQRKVLPITPAFCFAHARRGFFELAEIEKTARDGQKGKPVSPIALEAVSRLDALFEIESAINGRSADERRAVRQERSKPLLGDMRAWLLREREILSRSSEVLTHELHAQALGRLCPLPRRSQDLTQQQRRRKSVARHRLGKAQLDLRRQPARRRPRRHHADDDHDLPPQRCRSQCPARRRPRPYL